jgi:hypothetical protein
MRAAIITSKDPLVQVDPLVIVEDDKGIIKYYSKDKDSDKKDFWRSRKARRIGLTLRVCCMGTHTVMQKYLSTRVQIRIKLIIS